MSLMKSIFHGVLIMGIGIFLFTFCKPEQPLDPAAQKRKRGKTIYALNCTACHNSDPALEGPVGPSVKKSDFALLKAKLLKGEYPPGYKARRSTKSMTLFAMSNDEIAALAAFLAE